MSSSLSFVRPSFTCPPWCASDHGPNEGRPGDCVIHDGRRRRIVDQGDGFLYGPLYMARVRIEGSTDGSDCDGLRIWSEPGDYYLELDDAAAARQLAAVLLEAADQMEAQRT